MAAAAPLQVHLYTANTSPDAGNLGVNFQVGMPGDNPEDGGDEAIEFIKDLGVAPYTPQVAELLFWLSTIDRANPEGALREGWHPLGNDAGNQQTFTELYVAAFPLADPFWPTAFPIAIIAPRLQGVAAQAAQRLGNDLLRRAVTQEAAAAPPLAAIAVAHQDRPSRDDVFKSYKLHGLTDKLQALTDNDLDELLGDGWDAGEAGPANPAPVPVQAAEAANMGEEAAMANAPSPWTNYAACVAAPGAHDENCLINELVHRYSVVAKGKRAMTEVTIREAFTADGVLDTSIERLIAFATRRKVPLRIYNAVGTVIHASKGGGQRSGFALVAYKSHCWPFTGTTIASSQPILAPGCEIDACLIQPNPEMIRTLEDEEVWKSFLRAVKPAFYYKSESSPTPRSLMWDAPTNEQEYRVGIDMDKAFYSALHAAPDHERIPVWTPHNEIVVVSNLTRDALRAECYYLVSEGEYARWKTHRESLLCCRLNNLLTGSEAIYLVDTGRITMDVITGIKSPSYTVTANEFRKKLAKLAKDAGQDAEDFRKKFALYNGLLGVVSSPAKMTQYRFETPDADLVMATDHRAVDEDANDALYFDDEDEEVDHGRVLTLERGKAAYLHLSNRHLYGFVVAQTNLQMMRMHDRAVRDGVATNADLLRVRVDSLAYTSSEETVWEAFVASVAAPPQDAIPARVPTEYGWPSFKEELDDAGRCKPSHGRLFARTWLNPEQLRADTASEIGDWVQRHKGYQGAPGTGKTTLVRRDGGYQHAIALTNMCARALTDQEDDEKPTGETIHSKLHLFRPDELYKVASHLQNDTLWVDEISMVNPWIWSVLFVIGLRSHLILTGDPNQCPPIGSTESGQLTGDKLPWKSGMLLGMITDHSEQLNTDYRNDQGLIEFRSQINSDPEPLRCARNLIENFPQTNAAAYSLAEMLSIEHHICWGQTHKAKVNAAVAAQLGLKWSFEGVPRAMRNAIDRAQPQNKRGYSYRFTASKNLKLISRAAKKKSGILKGMFYRLMEDVSPDSLTAIIATITTRAPKTVDGVNIPAAEVLGNPITICAGALMDFGLGYCVTSPSSQGGTIYGPAVIHQLTPMQIGRAHV